MPLLVVISALAVFEAVRPGANSEGSGGGLAAPQDQNTEPVVTEAPGQTYAPEIFSAVLPPGGDIPPSGSGTFEVLPGTSEQVGSGTLYQYTVEVESGVQLAEGNDTFGTLVQSTLSDQRSWTNPAGGGIAVQRIDDAGTTPDFRVTLVSQQTAREVCGYDEGLPYDTSCRTGERVYINAARWIRGAIAFEGDIGSYRRYAINHEVGHVFENGHTACPAPGALAPVMMQQTLSTANNELHKLNQQASQGTEIPADGFVCRYNAWPFPAPSGAPAPG